MSQPAWSRITSPDPKILEFPAVARPESQPELPGALTYSSAENLIIQATHVLERVVRVAGSLSDNQRIDVLGHLLTLETRVLDPLTAWVERHRTFLSDLSAKQARKRRRRQKRVKAEIPKLA